MLPYTKPPSPKPSNLQPFDNRPHTYRYIPRGTFDAHKSLKSAHTNGIHYAYNAQPAYICTNAYPLPQWQLVQPAPAVATVPRYVQATPQPAVGYRYVAPNVIAAPGVAAPKVYHYRVANAHHLEHVPVGVNHGNGAYGYYHDHHGRTQEEVDHDNRIVAERSGAYDQHLIMPKDTKPESMFWCREKDGSWTLRSFFTIENDMKPGRWKMDAARGSLVYWRE